MEFPALEMLHPQGIINPLQLHFLKITRDPSAATFNVECIKLKSPNTSPTSGSHTLRPSPS